MKIDFRDVYGSMLKDWFGVDEGEVQALFDHPITFLPVMGACSLGIEDVSKLNVESIVFPNPCVDNAHLRVSSAGEWVKAEILDVTGKTVLTIQDGNLVPDKHDIPFNIEGLMPGSYLIQIQKKSGDETVKLVKRTKN